MDQEIQLLFLVNDGFTRYLDADELENIEANLEQLLEIFILDWGVFGVDDLLQTCVLSLLCRIYIQ